MAVPTQSAADVADEYLAFQFAVLSLLSRVATHKLVKVVACTHAGELAPWGTVDVIPLVGQVAGSGQVVPHGTVYRLPYFRVQGGKNAVIMDPELDDIGLAAFCDRDSSAVRRDPEAAVSNANAGKATPPGSARQYDMADGMYFGGFLNGVPEQYIQYNADGIKVLSPTLVRVEAPRIELVGEVFQSAGDFHIADNLTVGGNTQMAGNLNVDGDITVPTGDVTAGTITLKTHHTSGVTPGGGTSGPPVP